MSFMFRHWFEDEPADITKGELASLKLELESKEIKEDRIVAIKALEQNPCENAISRQAALDLCERFDGCVPYSVLSNYDMLPSVNPQPKTGHWLRMSDLSEQEDDRYKCSRCGNVVHYTNKMDLYTFNSWCGRCGSDNGRHINYEVEE